MREFKQTLAIAACGLAFAAPAAVAAEGEWQHTMFVYGMGAAIDGEVAFGGLELPVDVSISELFDALEMGGMAAYRADNGTWSFTVDATFMGLGGHHKSDSGRLKGDLEIDQITLMGTVGWHWTEHLEALFSLSYMDLSNELEITTIRPPSNEPEVRKAKMDANWVDPMIGLKYEIPLSDDWTLNLRGDIGGFGIGSDLAFQVLPNLVWKYSDKVSFVVGYRVVGFDYEDGHGADYEKYDLVEQGPLGGMAITF